MYISNSLIVHGMVFHTKTMVFSNCSKHHGAQNAQYENFRI